MKRTFWKTVANVAKIVIVFEMAALFIFTDRQVMDIIVLCFAQYMVFAPIDASVLLKNIRGGA